MAIGENIEVLDLADERFQGEGRKGVIPAIYAAILASTDCPEELKDTTPDMALEDLGLFDSAIKVFRTLEGTGQIIVPEDPDRTPCGMSAENAVASIREEVERTAAINCLPVDRQKIAYTIIMFGRSLLTKHVLKSLTSATPDEVKVYKNLLPAALEGEDVKLDGDEAQHMGSMAKRLQVEKAIPFVFAGREVRRILATRTSQNEALRLIEMINNHIAPADFSKFLEKPENAEVLVSAIPKAGSVNTGVISQIIRGITPATLAVNGPLAAKALSSDSIATLFNIVETHAVGDRPRLEDCAIDVINCFGSPDAAARVNREVMKVLILEQQNSGKITDWINDACRSFTVDQVVSFLNSEPLYPLATILFLSMAARDGIPYELLQSVGLPHKECFIYGSTSKAITPHVEFLSACARAELLDIDPAAYSVIFSLASEQRFPGGFSACVPILLEVHMARNDIRIITALAERVPPEIICEHRDYLLSDEFARHTKTKSTLLAETNRLSGYGIKPDLSDIFEA